MQGLEFLIAFAFGCLSTAALIRYKQKKAIASAMARHSSLKTNRAPVEVEFNEFDSDV